MVEKIMTKSSLSVFLFVLALLGAVLMFAPSARAQAGTANSCVTPTTDGNIYVWTNNCGYVVKFVISGPSWSTRPDTLAVGDSLKKTTDAGPFKFYGCQSPQSPTDYNGGPANEKTIRWVCQ
jgi:hypothetical protein